MNGWIPKEEDLPDMGDTVWVTIELDGVANMSTRQVTRAFMYTDGRWYRKWRELPSGAIAPDFRVTWRVLAWMPIEYPPPYEGPERLFDGGL